MKNLNFDEFTINKMPNLELSEISSAYISHSGKANLCMCGCAGDYYYVKENQKESGKNRGYEIKNEECNDKLVKYVLNRMTKNAKDCSIEVLCSPIKLEDGDKKLYKVLFKKYIFTIIIGKTQYTIYTV